MTAINSNSNTNSNTAPAPKTLKLSKISKFLSKDNTSPALFNAYCIFAAFGAYFCMYAFRKPFSVATFDGQIMLPMVGELDLKIAFIIAQVMGYVTSKFLGIKFVSEAKKDKRGVAILLLLCFAELALVAFAILPTHLKILAILANGLPLGMVWGLVFSFLEGRKSSELLGAGLSTSYIVASGAVKSVGKMVLTAGYSEYFMPVIVGLVFLPFAALFIYLLGQIPPPTKEDEAMRTVRGPMDSTARKKFFSRYAPGLIALTFFYMFLTAYRDFRDNFSREIWDALGYGDSASVFTASELPIALLVLLVLASVSLIKGNQKAVLVIHALLILGALLIGGSTFLFQLGVLSPLPWMITVGVGLYLGYVPFGCVLFDRIIAETKFIGTAAFMIYVTDAFGYLGSVAIMLYKNFGSANISWLNFFIGFSYVTAIACTAGFLFSAYYFRGISKQLVK